MITIDFMKLSDIDAVCEVDKSCFSVPWSKNAFLGDLENENTVYLIACDASKIIGYAGIWCVAGDGDITNIAVLEEYRRRGIAGRLLELLTEEAKKRNTQSIRLEVRESNKPAIALYEKYGFCKIGIRKNYYQDNKENALLMEKIILEEKSFETDTRN